VSNFDLLHPALQHHIVNSLGWRELRPFQDAVIPRLLAGDHQIVLAPTAGGKTEAATFPMLSRMLSEDWRGMSVLYICPIKALLNNLEHRLTRYCELLGRRATLWHGDTSATARRRIMQQPPDILLTTPESLEVMLVSGRIDEEQLFGDLRAVIVDEIHAFAGDDRGWHLLSVLDRVSRLAGRDVQRIGLSATVGNPDTLCDWLAGSCSGPRGIYRPEAAAAGPADVTLDYVGSLANAAIVISRLHHGEKRLVFCESRSRAEELGSELQRLGTTAFVTHSSLSVDQRRQAEDAFANRENCVIVATSVLELGIDVGDLDRVIQIDAPGRVASFLQRMGRTGRRPGTTRNCLFLATSDTGLVQAAALIDLWRDGYVEPIEPPADPFHVLAQQLLTLILQEQGIGRTAWRDWIGRMPGFAAMSSAEIERTIGWMIEQEILLNDAGILGIGERGEREYGWRNYMDVMSVFLTPPLVQVLHGRRELGLVDRMSFMPQARGRPTVLSLGGLAWLVRSIDWSRGIAYVEPAADAGRSRWKGAGPGLGFTMARRIRDLLATDVEREWWSRRTCDTMTVIRAEYPWLVTDGTAIVAEPGGELAWWTFAGKAVNGTLAAAIQARFDGKVGHDNFAVRIETGTTLADLEALIADFRSQPCEDLHPVIAPDAVAALKFADCVPPVLAERMLQNRSRDAHGLATVLASPVRAVVTPGTNGR
jgi:ATP-dependent Lhr-like helicase